MIPLDVIILGVEGGLKEKNAATTSSVSPCKKEKSAYTSFVIRTLQFTRNEYQSDEC